MASSNLPNAAAATPGPTADVPRPNRPPDRRLRLEDILKLMVADGLVPAADAEKLRSSRTHRFEHPLEMIADQKWRSPAATHPVMTL